MPDLTVQQLPHLVVPALQESTHSLVTQSALFVRAESFLVIQLVPVLSVLLVNMPNPLDLVGALIVPQGRTLLEMPTRALAAQRVNIARLVNHHAHRASKANSRTQRLDTRIHVPTAPLALSITPRNLHLA